MPGSFITPYPFAGWVFWGLLGIFLLFIQSFQISLTIRWVNRTRYIGFWGGRRVGFTFSEYKRYALITILDMIWKVTFFQYFTDLSSKYVYNIMSATYGHATHVLIVFQYYIWFLNNLYFFDVLCSFVKWRGCGSRFGWEENYLFFLDFFSLKPQSIKNPFLKNFVIPTQNLVLRRNFLFIRTVPVMYVPTE